MRGWGGRYYWLEATDMQYGLNLRQSQARKPINLSVLPFPSQGPDVVVAEGP
jgi:hypothetical protein